MALRWLVTETMTGAVAGEATVDSPSLTSDLDRSGGSAEIRIGHMIREDESLDLPRAAKVATWIEPAGAYSLTCIDMEDNAAWGGAFDRVIGEWMIRGGSPSSDGTTVPVTLGGILAYAGDRLLEKDYRETGNASWIVSDLLRFAFADIAITVPKPTLGPVIPVDWEAGKVTYWQAVSDVLDASGLELRVAYDVDFDRGSPSKVRREVVMGLPLYRLNTGRVIDAGPGGNGISVTRPTDIALWANSVNVYGAGSGRDQVAGNAFRGRPGKMPTVTRSVSKPDVQSNALATAMATQHLAEQTGIGPLQVEVLRKNWTNKYPTIGDAHRVVVDPCLAFPWGIDGVYRITRIQYQPPDGRGGLKPDTLQLVMEVST